MSGYAYGEHEPTESCPFCGTVCRADFVDIGVGLMQCGPYHCDTCGASEQGPNDKERPLTDEERRTGWYAPGSDPGSSANVIGGRVVSHVQAREAYRREFTDNPLWHDKKYVDGWWAEQRRRAEPALLPMPEYVPAAALAERDATIAALRADVADLLPMLDADAMTISNQQAEIARLRAGITAAVEGRYDRVPDRTGAVLTCDHGAGAFCLVCLDAHLAALLDPQAPDAGEG